MRNECNEKRKVSDARRENNKSMKRESAGIPIYQVDAFAEKPFEGNPAAVCLLNEARSAGWMQSVAVEMNLSETAFVRQLEKDYEILVHTNH